MGCNAQGDADQPKAADYMQLDGWRQTVYIIKTIKKLFRAVQTEREREEKVTTVYMQRSSILIQR